MPLRYKIIRVFLIFVVVILILLHGFRPEAFLIDSITCILFFLLILLIYFPYIKKIKLRDFEMEFKEFNISKEKEGAMAPSVAFRRIGYEPTLRFDKAERFNAALNIAAHFVRLKEWRKVAKYVEEALQAEPDNIGLRLQLSIIYGERIGDKEMAIYHCQEVLKRDHGNISAKFNLAVYTNHFKGAAYSLTIYREAEQFIEGQGFKGTEISGKLNLFIGHDFRDIGNKPEAERRYRKAIEILGKLANQGDEASAFWLQNAKNNLKKLLKEKE